MRLFEYVVIYQPKKNNENNDGKAQIIVDITRVLAKDQSSATLLAARAIPNEWIDKLDECEVAVRPF